MSGGVKSVLKFFWDKNWAIFFGDGLVVVFQLARPSLASPQTGDQKKDSRKGCLRVCIYYILYIYIIGRRFYGGAGRNS